MKTVKNKIQWFWRVWSKLMTMFWTMFRKITYSRLVNKNKSLPRYRNAKKVTPIQTSHIF